RVRLTARRTPCPYTTLFRSAVRGGLVARLPGAGDVRDRGARRGGGRGAVDAAAGEAGRPPGDRADAGGARGARRGRPARHQPGPDRKSTRLNSSHVKISYAV